MKIALKYKLRSGALQFTIFIGVLIALLLAGLILYAYTFTYLKEQSKAAIANIHMADMGISFLLKENESGPDTLSLPVTDINQSVKLNLSQWGIFQKAFAESKHRKKSFIKAAIIGAKVDADAPTLFLQESFTPLALVGNTTIKGTAWLPSMGVKPGYIAGRGYYGKQLIYGTVKRSGSKLPELDKECIEALAFYCNQYKSLTQEDYISLAENQKNIYSFKKKPKGFYSKDVISLDNISISGNVVIKSDTLIRIKKNAILKDIVIIAPIVEIEDGTTGNFQVIAAQSIIVGMDCQLNYPSALVVFQNENRKSVVNRKNNQNNQIHINAGSVIKGLVCYLPENEETDYKSGIVLEVNARIKGQVYCKANFELKGTVSGSVYAKQFVCNMAGSVFINHIFNGTIENESIPEIYGGILFENQPKAVMKWLY